jgi:hypothetical protein
MGIIDPVGFGGMVTTVVLEYGSAPIIWALTLGLLGAAAAAIAASVWHPRRPVGLTAVGPQRRAVAHVVGRAA